MSAMLAGAIACLIGLTRTTLPLNEKGFYFIVLMLGLFSTVSLQKTVRDRIENIPVTQLYFFICWAALIMSLVLLAVGLWNPSMTSSEQGFYAISFSLTLFGAITVQKNVRNTTSLNQTIAFDINKSEY